MFKNLYTRLFIVSLISTLALLAALPQIPIKMDNKFAKFDTFIGGYNINLFGGKFKLDLRDLKKGLDLKGGIRVVLQADLSQIPSADQAKALESAKDIIERRVNMLGVAEPYVATTKTNDEARIIVEIPGVDNVSEAVGLIGQTAQLRFKQLMPDKVWADDKFAEYYMDPKAWEDTGLTGADMKGAEVLVGQSGDLQTQGKPQIQLKFTTEGIKKFSEIAKKNIGKPIALYLDDGEYPLSAPIVSPDLANGLTTDPVITGTFDFNSAKTLSIQIRAGALPVPVKVMEQETIGATLGDESVRKSFFAGAVGLGLVALFLIFKYGRLGIVAGFSLLIYSSVVLAIFKIIPVTLTLPGIAGFVLSVGMATDANILIFERMKEEIMWGKPKTLALKLGFDRAWNSIKDSNASSLITSFILFQLGTGPVRGFALTLAIGIIVSLFTSIFVVRVLIETFDLASVKPSTGFSWGKGKK